MMKQEIQSFNQEIRSASISHNEKNDCRTLHCFDRRHLFDMLAMFEDEVTFSEIGDLYIYAYLTEDQYNSLIAIEYPMIY